MQNYVDRLHATVERESERLRRITDAEAALRPLPGKWSPKEVIGHLIDSASNNHQRFLRARFQDHLVFSGYDQDAWVESQQYAQTSWDDLIELWRAFNLHLARVMAATPESIRCRSVHQHNFDQIAWRTVPRDQPVTLDYFMTDYVDHLEHHLEQIRGG